LSFGRVSRTLGGVRQGLLAGLYLSAVCGGCAPCSSEPGLLDPPPGASRSPIPFGCARRAMPRIRVRTSSLREPF
jgi:hypothetical protein